MVVVVVGYWWYWLRSGGDGGGCSGRVLQSCDCICGGDSFCRLAFVIVVGVLQLHVHAVLWC